VNRYVNLTYGSWADIDGDVVFPDIEVSGTKFLVSSSNITRGENVRWVLVSVVAESTFLGEIDAANR
jgi:hypothetical protein